MWLFFPSGNYLEWCTQSCAEVTLTEIRLRSHHSHLLDHLLLLWLHDRWRVLSQLAEESWRLRGVGRRTGAHSAGGGATIRLTHTEQRGRESPWYKMVTILQYGYWIWCVCYICHDHRCLHVAVMCWHAACGYTCCLSALCLCWLHWHSSFLCLHVLRCICACHNSV